MSGVSKEPVEDFLDEDREIPSQKFVCVSFLKPTDVVQRKQLFLVHKFLQKMSSQYDLDLKTVTETYDDFVYANRVELASEFDELVDFQTSVYGMKVRGSYSTEREARVRAKVLQRMDPTHHVWVASVGKWLGFDFEADDIAKQEYANEELNKLMKAYKENQENRDMMYQEETRARIEQARKDGENAAKVEGATETDATEEVTEEATEALKDSIESTLTKNLESDPWMARKEASETNDFEDI